MLLVSKCLVGVSCRYNGKDNLVPEIKALVYCLSGARSGRAITALKEMGYTNLTNLDGIRAWHGEIEK